MKIFSVRYLNGVNVWSSCYKQLLQFTISVDLLNQEKLASITEVYNHLEKSKDVVFQNDQNHDSTIIEAQFLITLAKIGLLAQPEDNQLEYYFNYRATAKPRVYLVAFSYNDFETASKVIEFLKSILVSNDQKNVLIINEQLEAISKIYFKNKLGPSTASIVAAAEFRGIPWRKSKNYSRLYLGHGSNQKQFQATIAQTTSCLAVHDVGNKQKTKNLLSAMYIPVPQGTTCDSEADLHSIINKLKYPLVIKPINGNQGKGATINITNYADAQAAFRFAQTFSITVIVEKYFEGSDFRILLIDFKVVAAAKRNPAHIVGDGIHSIEQLIDSVNKNPERGVGHSKILTKISIDQDTHNMLQKQNLTLESVVKENKIVFIKSTSNLSTGGTAEDVTDTIHPENIKLAERAARIMNLDICGLDIIAKNLSEPIAKNHGVILEVNAAPGFRMHLAPSFGIARPVGNAVVDMLYPENTNFKIPIIAITGTNGKTTITRLLAYITKTAGFRTGFTTTDGIYINDTLIAEGDMTGPRSAEIVLSDPTVDFAVLETARGGIIKAGVNYGSCDVGIISNIQGDHLGLHNIDTTEDLANVKAVVAHSVKSDGWAVLNGQDENCIKIAQDLNCKYAYFLENYDAKLITSFNERNIPVAYFENGNLTIIKESDKISVAEVMDIPLTIEGTCKFMMANVLAATLAAFLQGISVPIIAKALKNFVPDRVNTPGRMNHFDINGFEVIVDYAHNVFGYKAMNQFLQKYKGQKIIGIIAAVGDRRDQDIIECGALAAQMFDHIIIRQEADLRGRESENITQLLQKGIASVNNFIPVEIINNEQEAVEKAMNLVNKGEIIVALSKFYQNFIDAIQLYKHDI